jgi:hypothetical protein
MFETAASFRAFHVVASFAFGAPSGFMEKAKDTHNLIQIVDARGEFMNAIGSLSSTLRSNMRYNPFDDSWTVGSKARAGLESIGRAAYERRKAPGGDSRKDLLSFLFNAKDEDWVPAERDVQDLLFPLSQADEVRDRQPQHMDYSKACLSSQSAAQSPLNWAKFIYRCLSTFRSKFADCLKATDRTTYDTTNGLNDRGSALAARETSFRRHIRPSDPCRQKAWLSQMRRGDSAMWLTTIAPTVAL